MRTHDIHTQTGVMCMDGSFVKQLVTVLETYNNKQKNCVSAKTSFGKK